MCPTRPDILLYPRLMCSSGAPLPSNSWFFYDRAEWLQVTGLGQYPPNVLSYYDSFGGLIEMKTYDSFGHLLTDQDWSYYGSTQQVSEWTDYNYQTNGNKSAEAIIYYSQGGTTNTAAWLSWLGVVAPTGSIIRTETWDYTDTIAADMHDHEVRAFWSNQWVVRGSRETTVIAGRLPRLMPSRRRLESMWARRKPG